MLNIILVLTIALPILWFVSEFRGGLALRLVAGCAAIATSFLVAAGVGLLDRFNSNAWYGGASKELIDTTIEEIERGDTERLLAELRVLQQQFEPTYENRANYDQLIEDFKSRLGRETKTAEQP